MNALLVKGILGLYLYRFGHKRSMILGALTFFFLFIANSSFAQVMHEAAIKSPRLSYLDTDQGLDQNTIHDILVDRQGFVWIGTDEGLNRFDGTKVLQVNDINNHIVNSSIYHIFEHSSGKLILSTSDRGIVSLDLLSKKVETVLAIESKLAPGWLQDSSVIFETTNGDIVIGLNESVYRYSLDSGNAKLLYQLSDAQIDQGFSIRSLYQHKQTLFVGTTLGLLGINLNSNEVLSIFSLGDAGADTANVKLLKSFDKETLFVGTVRGLHAFNLAELDKYITQSWGEITYVTIEEVRNVWDMATIDGKLYFASDIGIHSLDSASFETTFLFQAIKNYETISTSDILNLSVDRAGNLWFGTEYSGAMRWSPNSQLFKNVNNSIFTSQNKKLSNNIVWAIYQYDADNLYIGTNNGLNLFNLSTDEIEYYYKTSPSLAKHSESEIASIYSSEKGFLWLITGDGLRKFDVKTKQFVSITFDDQAIDAIFQEFIYSFIPLKDNIYWVLTDNGAFYIDAINKHIRQVDLASKNLAVADTYKFLGVDKKSKMMLLASAAQLWGINTDTLTLTLLHSVKAEGTARSVYPGSFSRDHTGTFWLAYPGHGLYKLHGNTFATLAKYSDENYLPTNLIYDLKLDNDGLLWFSSHSGLHRFDTDSMRVQNFGFANGLATSEFNEGANEVLSDGSLVYGANLGFTKFHPTSLNSENLKLSAPFITELDLSSRRLNIPLTILNNKTISLNHDDVGLTLYFSTLSNNMSGSNQYQYRILSGNKISAYPNLSEGKLLLPALSPGKHTIEIFPAGVNNQAAVASLHLDIAYPRFFSPLAYVTYAVLLMLTLFVWYWRRHKLHRLINSANQQIKQNNKQLTDALLASNANIWEWKAATNLLQGERLAALITVDDKYHKTTYPSVSFDKFIQCIHENDRQAYISAWNRFMASKDIAFDITYRVLTKENTTKWYRDVGNKQFANTDGKLVAVQGTYINLTKTIATQNRLKQFGHAFKHTRDWVLIFDSNRTLVASNPSFKKAFELLDDDNQFKQSDERVIEHQELFYKTLKKLGSMQAGEHLKIEHVVQLGSKSISLLTNIDAIASELDASKIDSYLIISTDISAQVKSNKALQEIIHYDQITGLMKRNLLIERLQQSIEYANAHDDLLAVLFIDLDGFKLINDSFGHEAGDIVLSEIANRLLLFFGENTTVARVGGDEYVVILENIASREEVDKLAHQLLKKITPTIALTNHLVSVTASIGIAVLNSRCHKAEKLLGRADIATNTSKAQGKNKFSYFTDSMNEQIQSKITLQNNVKVATTAKQFTNHYQPIIDTSTGKTVGFEILLRWPLLSNDKPLQPADFIATAEEIGCIIDISNHALEVAITDLVEWRKLGFDGYISMNLSKQQIDKKLNLQMLRAWQDKFDIPNKSIKFEINEDVLRDKNISVSHFVEEVRQFGFEIALDDFGKDLTHLQSINDFSFDILKIDRHLVGYGRQKDGANSIVDAVFKFADSMPHQSIAKGVETIKHLEYVTEYNCQFVQGFLFSKPIPFADTLDILFVDWFQNINIKQTRLKKGKAKIIPLTRQPK